jgi:hypothetical protein
VIVFRSIGSGVNTVHIPLTFPCGDYRLEFYDIGTRESTIVEVSIKDPAENCIPRIVEEIVGQRPEKTRSLPRQPGNTCGS